MTFYQNRKYHYGDKTILRPSYLHNGIPCTDKMTSLYWIKALMLNDDRYLRTEGLFVRHGKVIAWHPMLKYMLIHTTDTCTSFDINTLRRNGRHFVEDIFCIYLNENVWNISMGFNRKYVNIGSNNGSDNNPISEPMMIQFTDAYMRHPASMSKSHYLRTIDHARRWVQIKHKEISSGRKIWIVWIGIVRIYYLPRWAQYMDCLN